MSKSKSNANTNTGNLNSALQQLEALITSMHEENADSSKKLKKQKFLSGTPILVSLSSSQGQISMGKESGAKYIACLEAFEKAIHGRNAPLLSRHSLEKRVEAAVFAALVGSDSAESDFPLRLKSACDALRKALTQAPCEWKITLKVEGLIPEKENMRFGQVEFVLGNPANLQELRDSVNATSEEDNVIFGDGRTRRERAITEIDEQFADAALARVTVRAVDQVAAQQIALAEVRRTLDIINLFVGYLLPFGCWAYLPGEAVPSTMLILAQPQQANDQPTDRRDDFLLAPSGAFAPFSVIGLREGARSLGWDIIDELLGKQTLARDEERVLRACTWAGRALTPRREEEAFLYFAVAMETLLLGGNYKDELSYRIRTRAAWLLGENFAQRKSINGIINTLYGTRSKIVHQGLGATARELAEVRAVALEAIFKVLSAPDLWRNTSDSGKSRLDEWFDDKMLGKDDEPQKVAPLPDTQNHSDP